MRTNPRSNLGCGIDHLWNQVQHSVHFKAGNNEPIQLSFQIVQLVRLRCCKLHRNLRCLQVRSSNHTSCFHPPLLVDQIIRGIPGGDAFCSISEGKHFASLRINLGMRGKRFARKLTIKVVAFGLKSVRIHGNWRAVFLRSTRRILVSGNHSRAGWRFTSDLYMEPQADSIRAVCVAVMPAWLGAKFVARSGGSEQGLLLLQLLPPRGIVESLVDTFHQSPNNAAADLPLYRSLYCFDSL